MGLFLNLIGMFFSYSLAGSVTGTGWKVFWWCMFLVSAFVVCTEIRERKPSGASTREDDK